LRSANHWQRVQTKVIAQRVSRAVPVGMEDDRKFYVIRRIIGPNGDNIKRIANQFKGSHAQVRGRGTEHESDKPLYILVTASSDHMKAAEELAKKLVAEVREKYTDFCATA